VDSYGTKQGPVDSAHDHSNVHSGSIKCGALLN